MGDAARSSGRRSLTDSVNTGIIIFVPLVDNLFDIDYDFYVEAVLVLTVK
jgi:hypothetical protein